MNQSNNNVVRHHPLPAFTKNPVGVVTRLTGLGTSTANAQRRGRSLPPSQRSAGTVGRGSPSAGLKAGSQHPGNEAVGGSQNSGGRGGHFSRPGPVAHARRPNSVSRTSLLSRPAPNQSVSSVGSITAKVSAGTARSGTTCHSSASGPKLAATSSLHSGARGEGGESLKTRAPGRGEIDEDTEQRILKLELADLRTRVREMEHSARSLQHDVTEQKTIIAGTLTTNPRLVQSVLISAVEHDEVDVVKDLMERFGVDTTGIRHPPSQRSLDDLTQSEEMRRLLREGTGLP